MLIGMSSEGELCLHLKAAKSNGVNRAKIKEVLMQSSIYGGIQAARYCLPGREVWGERGVEALD